MAPAAADHRYLSWVARGVPVLLATAVYLNALHNGFVYDDFRLIVENPSIRNLASLDYVLGYERFRPLVNLTYAIDYRVWGAGPFGFHLTSVLLHALGVLLFTIFVERLVRHAAATAAPRAPAPGGSRTPHDPASAPRPALVALAAASVLAVHPLLTEGVGYVSGRSEVLCTVFFMAALLSFQRLFGGGHRAWAAAGLCFWLLSIGAREVGAMLPLVLLAYDLLLLEPTGRRRRLWLHATLIGVVGVAGLVRVGLYLRESSAPTGVPAWHYIQTQFRVTWRYLGLFVLPVNQSLMPAVRMVSGPASPLALLAGAGLVALTWLTLQVRRRLPLVPFGLLWFFLALAPSALVPLREPMAEHRAYLATYGLVIGATSLGVALLARLGARASRGALAAVAAIVALLGGATVVRNRDWKTPVTLLSDAVAKAPRHPVALRALGDEYLHLGRCDHAIPYFQRAADLTPEDSGLRNNLGICLAKSQRLDEARQVFAALARDNPGYAKAHNNLGRLAADAGRREEAIGHHERALAAEPNNEVAHRALQELRAGSR